MKNAETKTTSSRPNRRGEGNKNGTRYDAARAVDLTPERASELERKMLSAAKLRKEWDYRSFGLTIDDARAYLRTCASDTGHQKIRWSAEYGFGDRELESPSPYQYSPRVTEYLRNKAARDANRGQNARKLEKVEEARSLKEINEQLQGYPCRYGCKIRLDQRWLLLTRHESAQWNEQCHWPVSQQTSYTADLIGTEGDTIRTFAFSDRRGDWLTKVGVGLSLRCGERTKITQSAAMLPESTVTRHSVQFTVLRLYGCGFSEIAAHGMGAIYHAATFRDAMAGLVLKIRKGETSRGGLLNDSAVLTLQDANNLGFCGSGIEYFLQEIGMEGRTWARVRDLRRLINTVDHSRWNQELIAIGLLKEPGTDEV